MYTAIARAAIASSNLEQLVVVMHEMFEHEMTPNTALLKHLVRLACEWGCPRLALQMVEKVEAISRDGQRADTAIWIQILMASTDNQYVRPPRSSGQLTRQLSGVVIAWDRAIQSKAYTPDEGLVLTVLNVAARWGKPDLATKALAVLPDLAIRPQELHLVPLLEAYVTAGQLPESFKVLSSIRQAGMTPSMITAEPIVSALATVDLIDQAFYALEDMHQSGHHVDIVALNAIIEASVRRGDLQRVRATQAAAAELGLSPDRETFNVVLQGCVQARHRPLGDTILSEMSALSITPDVTTYRQMIMLCLTQPSYEDAFHYLERMKADGIKPPYGVYQALMRRCVYVQDKRWRLIKDEMESLGYRLDRETQLELSNPQRSLDDESYIEG